MVTRSRAAEVGWVLATNLFLLAGVVGWGWPPGNVFLLFWVENAILGVATFVRILTAEGAPSVTASGPNALGRFSRGGQAGFFVLHYGLFAVVHLVFVVMLAVAAGTSWTFWALGLPALLIGLRYAVDLATRWFRDGQRRRVSAERAFWSPYPRLIVLHVATVLGFVLVIPLTTPARPSWLAVLDPLRDWFTAHGLTLGNGALLVALLMLLKTAADLALLRGWTPRGDLRVGLAD